ncbi:unnamed protein product [Mycena citricolor]|uniref:Reverse transcriptase domain-containing protein n=1 Tax=Mycena citricolor TaxID=2018698 RepID=A0AAD2HJ36_9AGAR|nr:unnamed protein product [Mycena citricolor]
MPTTSTKRSEGPQKCVLSAESSDSHAPSSSFGKTLQYITSLKLEELEKQRLAYASHLSILGRASDCGDDLVRRVELLLEGVRSWHGSGAVDRQSMISGKLDLANLDLWLLQARQDPGFSADIVREWADTLETHIRHNATRFEFAKLFGGLFNEWMDSGDSSIPTDLGESVEDFVRVGRKEMGEQQDRLQSIIFESKSVDTDAITAYLGTLFEGDDAPEVLAAMRRSLAEFETDLQRQTITSIDLRWMIQSLLGDNLMTEDKRNTLQEFARNPTVLDELATVLTMRLADLESWKWGSGVPLEMRRALNGKYRGYTDPDILDALLLQYIGLKWQVKFKAECTKVFDTEAAWTQAFPGFARGETYKLRTFFEETTTSSIKEHRKLLQKQHFLVGQLSTTVDSGGGSYDGEGDNRQTPTAHVKQELLHLVATECYLNSTLHKTHTVVCSDFEWFGPSLSFDTIVTCLAFFGVSPKWIAFFRRFLEVPLTFANDAPGSPPRIRKCGTPISYALSTFFGESVLFCLDLGINRRTDGLFLYRIHDDIWFWDSDSSKCAAAWAELIKFADLTGLKINQEKTGSVSIGGSPSPGIPTGPVRWGFLKLDAEKQRFVIDQAEVDLHIAELRRQLASRKSIFGWINAYNKYMAFFSRNFGARPTVSFGPALCLGQAHVDDMLGTLARVQRELFPEENGAVGHLRTMIKDRFGVDGLPDGYFYFPIASGGMELRNALIELLAVRANFPEDPAGGFTEQIEKGDLENYLSAKERWSRSLLAPQTEEFPSFESFVSYRETASRFWRERYVRLLGHTQPTWLRLPDHLQRSKWQPRDFYDRWVLALYGDQVIQKFGTLEAVDPNLIPVGMVHLFRGSRHQWDQ